MSTERVINRVRKMLALAKDGGATEGERDNALRMAHATIAKYNLDMAAVESAGPRKPASAPDEPRDFYTGVFYGRPWARQVAGACAELFFCEYLYVPATVGKNTKHLYIGRASNALTAIEMAKWLIESIKCEATRYSRHTHGGNYDLRSFALGAAIKIAQRAADLRAPVRRWEAERDAASGALAHAQEPQGTALVLATVYESERKANQALIEKRVPKRKTGHSGKHFSISAASDGAKYGATLNLDKQVKS